MHITEATTTVLRKKLFLKISHIDRKSPVKNTYFEQHLLTAASVVNDQSPRQLLNLLNIKFDLLNISIDGFLCEGNTGS